MTSTRITRLFLSDGGRLDNLWSSDQPIEHIGCTRDVDLSAGGTPARKHPGGAKVRQDNPDDLLVSANDADISARSKLNLIAGSGIDIGVADDPTNDRTNATITSLGVPGPTDPASPTGPSGDPAGPTGPQGATGPTGSASTSPDRLDQSAQQAPD